MNGVATARVVPLVLAVVVACGGGAGVSTASDSGIEGIVTIGPTCPVEQPGQACDDRPFSAEVRVVRRDGSLVTTFRSRNDGRFRVALSPGDYRLEPVSPNGNGLPFGKPIDVTVRAHTYEDVTVSFDSGIR